MAVTKDWTHQGFTLTGAYHRVCFCLIEPESTGSAGKVMIRMATYKDKATRDADPGNHLKPIKTYQIPEQVGSPLAANPDWDNYFAISELDTVSQNPQERAYAYLKAAGNDLNGGADVDPD